jgi:hypothetical protein
MMIESQSKDISEKRKNTSKNSRNESKSMSENRKERWIIERTKVTMVILRTRTRTRRMIKIVNLSKDMDKNK